MATFIDIIDLEVPSSVNNYTCPFLFYQLYIHHILVL